MSTQELLEDSLKEPAIGQTSKFHWHATPIGIAALCKKDISDPPTSSYEDALKEGLEVGLDVFHIPCLRFTERVRKPPQRPNAEPFDVGV